MNAPATPVRLDDEGEGAVSAAVSPSSGDGQTPSAPDGANVITHSFCGTEHYMAPEVLLQKGHSSAVDFWSLGILFSEMLTGKHPFRGNNHHGTLRNIVSPGLSGNAVLCEIVPVSTLVTVVSCTPCHCWSDVEARG